MGMTKKKICLGPRTKCNYNSCFYHMSYTTFTISWEIGPTVRIKIAHVIKKKGRDKFNLWISAFGSLPCSSQVKQLVVELL